MKLKTLFVAAAVSLAAFVANPLLAQCAAGAVKKDIALQLYSLRDMFKKDYETAMKTVGEMGYTAVEAAGYAGGKFYGQAPEKFKADVEKYGMKVLSSHTAKALSDKELKTKDFSESLKWWDDAIAAHKAAGMEYIVMPWMPTPKTVEDLDTYCKYYNAVGKKCKDAGLKFGYHNHAFEFQKIENKEMMYDYLIKNTDPDLVFFEMDVYWVVRGQNSPVEYFKKYPNRFQMLHIKDHKELGESGMVGFDAIFKNIEPSGAKHLVVEVERYDFAPEVSVKKSLEYLQKAPYVKESYNK